MGVKVRQRGGAWWLFIDHAGKRKAKRVGDKKAAELAATKIRAKLAEGDLTALEPTPVVPTFKEYAERWLKGVATLRCQASTVEQYRNRLEKRLLPYLGSLPLTAITRDRVKALVAEIVKRGNLKAEGQASAPKTVKDAMQTLTTLLNSAVDDGLLTSNPATRWGRVVRQDQAQVEEVEVFTAEELTKVLGTAEERFPDHYAFVLALARTGMRIGEAMALKWADVDWPNRVIIVRRSMRRGETKVPKNGKARRVDMSRQLGAALEGRKSVQDAEATVAGTPSPDWVFPAMGTAPTMADSFRQHVWTALLKAAGVRYRKIHALRHSFASLLIEAGEPLTYVQQQLGHHSAAFTLAVYGHLMPRGSRRAVDRLDDATGRNLYATGSERTPTMARG